MKSALFATAATLLLTLSLASKLLADAVWIDVRSPEEYQADHIAGDMNIPVQQIGQQIADKVADKNAEIAVYCLSGGRAGTAKQTLEQLGYTQVRNAGGIADARKQRGLQK